MNQTAGVADQCRRRSSADFKEFGDGGPDRNWKGITISLLVIVVVMSLIGLAIFLLSNDNNSKSLGTQLMLDDLFQKDFQMHNPDAVWISDEELIYRTYDGDVMKLDLQSNHTSLLLKNITFATFKADTFTVSPDLNYVLLSYDMKKLYRFSFSASYLIYNLQTREVHELNPPEVSQSVLQFASWGVRGQQLIFIFENNIYYKMNVKSSSLRLTSSGQEQTIFNGIADWLYEEEVLRSHTAHWWSPKGSTLAFLTINDTLVPNMQLPRFTGSPYPHGHQYPYPKAGQFNPSVKLFVVTLDDSNQLKELLPPDKFDKSDYYITMVKWLTDQKLAVHWFSRAQDTSILSLCEITTGRCAKKHVMTQDKWIERQNQQPFFSKDFSVFFLTKPIKQGGKESFHHIAMISDEGGKMSQQYVTSGKWEVTEILEYDDNTNTVFFLSNEDGVAQRHLYRVSTVDRFHRECLTCTLLKPHCSYYDAALSPGGQRVVLSCRGPGLPRTTVHHLTDMSSEGTLVLERNSKLNEALRKRKFPRREFKTLLINGFALPLEISYPRDFEENGQYPLLLVLSSAPGGQSVSDQFHLDWDSVLVSSDNVVVARLDGRGSGFQGLSIMQDIYQRLGTVDVQDQSAAVEYLIKQPFIDQSRVGVYGQAYGGFLGSLLLLSPGSRFTCGISVAPVTNWSLYGSAFTERYFGFPAKYGFKYEISSLLPNITGTSTNLRFLIIHGTADASVHFQHSAELVKFLAASNINYTLQIFPDEGHRIQSRYYMLNSVLTFFRECFRGL
ncbi:inactive dipeptidyl peptidase 10 isoform X2 [Denticeps clupeoides]|uniref:Uncharacterized protein n=1 Tax=Denticeps clupeoides TaxID=299321 RepID=A0AAY4EUF1_9TELE|nr:inactive dipeptidyl peptidase 10-like isoform X2 [Denticeps clupeoides]